MLEPSLYVLSLPVVQFYRISFPHAAHISEVRGDVFRVAFAIIEAAFPWAEILESRRAHG
jgi:hypothetical protein